MPPDMPPGSARWAPPPRPHHRRARAVAQPGQGIGNAPPARFGALQAASRDRYSGGGRQTFRPPPPGRRRGCGEPAADSHRAQLAREVSRAAALGPLHQQPRKPRKRGNERQRSAATLGGRIETAESDRGNRGNRGKLARQESAAVRWRPAAGSARDRRAGGVDLRAAPVGGFDHQVQAPRGCGQVGRRQLGPARLAHARGRGPPGAGAAAPLPRPIARARVPRGSPGPGRRSLPTGRGSNYPRPPTSGRTRGVHFGSPAPCCVAYAATPQPRGMRGFEPPASAFVRKDP